MLVNPSILLSLLLLVKLASGTTLAGYFKPKILDPRGADNIFIQYRQRWETMGIVTTRALRNCLETTQNKQLGLVLKELIGGELDIVLNAILYPACTREMLINLKLATVEFELPYLTTVYAHVFIHQPWVKTKELLAKADNFENVVYLKAAGELVARAFWHKRFALIRTILNAVNQRHVQEPINWIMNAIPYGEWSKFRALVMLFIRHDTGKHITAKLLKTLYEKQGAIVSQDFVRIMEHPFVGSQQFARIITELLSSKGLYKESDVRELVCLAGPSDVPALMEHLKSKNMQKSFLQYFGMTPKDVDSGWLSVPLKKQDRHEEWHKRFAKLILKRLEPLECLLTKALHQIIADYAS